MSADNVFQKSVIEYLEAGLHTRRGLTAEEYIARCRKAWDSCVATEDCPFKLLIDPLRPISDVLQKSNQDYIHWRAEDLLANSRGDQSDVYCVSVGGARSDLTFGKTHEITNEEPDAPETRTYLVALFDVLGFSALLGKRGLDEVHLLYSRMVSEAVTKEAMRSLGLVRLNDNESCSTNFDLPVRHAHFSDTIILWTPLVQHFISPFLARCADLISEALKIGLPLRGAISAGEAILHQKSSTYLGEPIIEAARLEHAQNWIGATLGLSMLAGDITREFDPNLVIPYNVPKKAQTSDQFSGLVLDWPRRFGQQEGIDAAAKVLLSLNTSKRHGFYYKNTIRFVEFSNGPIIRRSGMRGASISGLAAAAAAARAEHTEMDAEHVSLLHDLRRVGSNGSVTAEYIERIARGESLPDLPRHLSPNIKRQLRGLELVVSGTGKYFNLHEPVLDALNARFTSTKLENDTLRMLAEFEQFDKRGNSVAAFIRELAAGGNPAHLSARGLPSGLGAFLRKARAWADGNVPSGAVSELANACLQSYWTGEPISAYHTKLLKAVGSPSPQWTRVASFLQALCNCGGDLPPLPDDIPKATMWSLRRVRYAASAAGVQRVRILELMSIGFHESNRGVDLFEIGQELSHAGTAAFHMAPAVDLVIKSFESSTEEQHRIVGQHLRAAAVGGDLPPIPSGISAIVGMFLYQLRSMYKGSPLPLDPQLVGWSAIRTRHEGGEIGDFTRFSLRAMLSANKDFKTIALYYCQLAGGGPAGPVPELTDQKLLATAKEMRCLAEPQVGGFRILVSPARKADADPE